MLKCISDILVHAKNIGQTYSSVTGPKTVLCLLSEKNHPPVVHSMESHGGVESTFFAQPLILRIHDWRGRLLMEKGDEYVEDNLNNLDPYHLAMLADFVGSMDETASRECLRHCIENHPGQLDDLPVAFSFKFNETTVKESVRKEDVSFVQDGRWWITLDTTDGLPDDGLYELTGKTDDKGNILFEGMTVNAYDGQRRCILDDISVNW